MSLYPYLFAAAFLLLLTLWGGFWLGRKVSRAETSAQSAEAGRIAEEANRNLQMELALGNQSRDQLRQQQEELKEALEDRRSAFEFLDKAHQSQSADLREAQTKVGERDHLLESLRKEMQALQDGLGSAQLQLRTQEGQLGVANRLQKNLEEAQTTLKAREEEIATIQTTLRDSLVRIQELETSATKDREALANERRQIAEGQQVFRQEFENLANQIFESKHQVFDTRSKEGLTSLLSPFKEQLESFRLRVDQVHTENVQGHTSLKGELDRLRELNQQITQEASNLTRALKGDKKVQGNWGEQKVELLLEQAGLRKDIEYSRERNFKDDAGNNLRPDFVVNLPEGKHIIVDSKVSLVDYAAYVASENPEQRQQSLAAHVSAIRNHIRSLSEKGYPELLGMDSPDFTFLFVAIEPAYLAAVEHCQELFQEAYDRRIALVTATTLLPVLRVVANLWSLQRQNQSTQLIADQASRVYDKLRVFLEKMEKLGNQLEMVQRTYKDSFDTLKDGKGSLVRTVDKFVELGVKVSKKLPASSMGNALPELEYAEAPEGSESPTGI